jgi:hypothetical protein
MKCGIGLFLAVLLSTMFIPVRSARASSMDQLKTRQSAERRDLEAGQKVRTGRLKQSIKADTEDFKRYQKEKRRVLEGALEEQKRAYEESIRGVGKTEREEKRLAYEARCKEEKSDLKQQQLMDSAEFSAEQRDRVAFLDKVEKEERRQLDEKQRLELPAVKP